VVVAMGEGDSNEGVPLRDFASAAAVGVAQAALKLAKRRDSKQSDGTPEAPEVLNDIFDIVQDIYGRLMPEQEITPETVERMVDGENIEARRKLLLSLAMPPVVRTLVQNLKEVHDRIQEFLQHA